MKVLVLSSVFPNPRQPALGVFVRERARRMARACAMQVVAPVPWFPLNGLIRGPRFTGIPPLERQDGLTVHHPRAFSVPRYLKSLDGLFYAASVAPVLARLRRDFAFDVIDAHFAYPDGLAGVLLGRLFRVPVMVTLRGSIVRLATYATHRPQLRWTLARASAVVSVSRSLRDVAVALGRPPERIRVIPNGVDTGRFRPLDRAAARAACGLPADRTVLLAVGGVYDGKGHHLVVEALPRLVRRYPDLLYVVVGAERPGERYRERLGALAERLGVARHLRLAGPRPPEELPAWYSAADLFCLATRSEGWANCLLEALACGLPVVTTRVGGNPEIVRDGVDGLLVPWGDVAALAEAIEAALERPWDRGALVAHAATHSWDETAARALEELRALVEGRVPAPAPAVASIGGGAPCTR
ncbi:MAG TPA: glycosyltransferase [Candidatus Binatia bacterium]|nr:glycosyltransferase [Candidatus Binatia bacterium]